MDYILRCNLHVQLYLYHITKVTQLTHWVLQTFICFSVKHKQRLKLLHVPVNFSWKKKIQKTKGRRQKMAVKQNYDFLRIVSFVETLMNSERYIVVLDLFGDQESVNMIRWCRKINWGTLPPSTKVAPVVHVSWKNYLFFLYSQRISIHFSVSLCQIFIIFYCLFSISLKFQGPKLSLVKNREY